ncbi:MAG: cation diffusion facilitator family transporter [Thermoplasmata archaeon]
MCSSTNSQKKKKAAYLSVTSNAFLTVFKLIVGIITGSISIISESLHSLNDLIAALIAAYAVKASAKPPDEEHKYGHGKIENISAMLEASLIIFAAVFIIHEAIDRIVTPKTVEIMELGIGVMLVSVLVNVVVSVHLKKTARTTDSAALEADAAHLNTDVYTSLGVFLGLVAMKITGQMLIDPLIAIFVAIYIIKIGIELIIKSARELMDTKICPEDERKVKRIIDLHKDSFVEVHAFRSRKSGSDRYLDMHIVMAKDTSIEKAHGIADHIEKEIAEKMPGTHAIVHLEPCDGKCTACKIKEKCGKS